MDFLKEIKAKMEELEEFSREAQAQAAAQQNPSGQKALFQPKGTRPTPKRTAGSQPQQWPQQDDQQWSHQQPQQQPRKAGLKPQEQFGSPGGSARRSRQPVDSDECGVEQWQESRTPARPAAQSHSIFDTLGERLDEAFVLQEILGKPRCLSGWDD